MRQPKRILALSPSEYRLMLYGLLHVRNKLLGQGKIPGCHQRAFGEAPASQEVPPCMNLPSD